MVFKYSIQSLVSCGVFDGSDLSEHFQSVGVHDGNTSKSGTTFKGLYEKGLSWFKFNFSVLVLGQFRRIVDLLAASLLAHLPVDLGHLARNLGGTAKDNRTVSSLEDTRVLLDSNNRLE